MALPRLLATVVAHGGGEGCPQLQSPHGASALSPQPFAIAPSSRKPLAHVLALVFSSKASCCGQPTSTRAGLFADNASANCAYDNMGHAGSFTQYIYTQRGSARTGHPLSVRRLDAVAVAAYSTVLPLSMHSRRRTCRHCLRPMSCAGNCREMESWSSPPRRGAPARRRAPGWCGPSQSQVASPA